MKIERKLIKSHESKISFLQMIGFVLMMLSIIYLLIKLIWFTISSNDISINFLILMLGFSFAFPSLLEGHEGLSTMRIVVFMVTNVVCMLLLKIGWGEDIKSLKDIGLNEYWMGIIAFAFGAKAAQSFFESKMSVPKGSESSTDITYDQDIPEHVLIEAINKHDVEWKRRYNVLSIGVGKKKVLGKQTNVNCLVFSPEVKVLSKEDIPALVPKIITYKADDDKIYNIPTDVIEIGSEIIATSVSQRQYTYDFEFPKKPGCSVSRMNDDSSGTIGLKVYRDGKQYLLSCYHVLCTAEMKKGVLRVKGAVTQPLIVSPSFRDNNKKNEPIADVIEGTLNQDIDCAIALLKRENFLDRSICYINKTPTTGITIRMEHVDKQYPVFTFGRTSKYKEGKVSSSYSNPTIEYEISGVPTPVQIRGLIETTNIGTRGDSGAPVVDLDGRVLGIIIAASNSSTYILPINRILAFYNLKLNPQT